MKMKWPTEFIRTVPGRIAQSIISIGEGPSRENVERPTARSSGHLPKKGAGPGFVPKPRR